jgi:hypothetical protein
MARVTEGKLWTSILGVFILSVAVVYSQLPEQQSPDRVMVALTDLHLAYLGITSYSEKTGIGPHHEQILHVPLGHQPGGACVFGNPRSEKLVEPDSIIASLANQKVKASIDEDKTVVPFVGTPSYVINFSYDYVSALKTSKTYQGKILITSNPALLTDDHWFSREIAVVYDN